jgi:predicted nucleic acid-binding protein
MNVFFDTNVLLDVLVKREPFYADSAAVWTLAEQGKKAEARAALQALVAASPRSPWAQRARELLEKLGR